MTYEDEEMALVLVRLAAEEGGRADPGRILQRPPDSSSRKAFLNAQDKGWLDGQGYVTDAGAAAIDWCALSC